jgi:hypothetical protein
MATKHPLVGQYVYKFIYGEGMTYNVYSFDMIIDVDDDYITFADAKVILKGYKWYLSGEIGTNIYKIRIVYSKKGTKAKKDKDKLYEKAIDNLNLKLCKGGMLRLSYPGYKTKNGFILEGY